MSELYNYDPTVRQYRRAKDTDPASPAAKDAPSEAASTDIYASSDNARPEPSASFFDQSRPGELRNFHPGKFLAWIVLLLMLAGWVYLIYLYLHDK